MNAARTDSKHLEEIRHGEGLVEEVEQTREQLRDVARRHLGVTGEKDKSTTPLRVVLRSHGLSVYPLIAIGLLAVVDNFAAYGFTVLAPEIAVTLGISKGAIAGVIAAKTLAVVVSPLPMAALVQKYPRRALWALITAFTWAVMTISFGFVVSLWGLFAVLVIDGLSTGSVQALHFPLLMDSYPPAGRMRVVTRYEALNAMGLVVAPLTVALLAGVLGYNWRGVFVALGTVSLLVALFCLRLRDPGFGRWDTQKIRASVHELHGEGAAVSEEDVRLGFFEITRRLFLIPTLRRLFIASVIRGMLLVPYQVFLFFFLQQRWGMGPGARGVFFAFLAAVSIAALFLFGKRGEAMFREDPRKVVELGSIFMAGGVVMLCLAALAPWFWLMVAFFALTAAMVAVLAPAIDLAILSVVPARMRPHTSALTGIFFGGVGGVSGAVLLSGVDARYGITGSLISLLVPGVIGALVLRSAGKLVPRDLDHMIDDVLEEEEIKRITSSGEHLPMLACRHIDFSYGQIQVLFDVDFTVDDGEMVALLGTNGAGKSTLLKVISGIGLPSRGTVRFRGADISYLDAERRVGLGITQVPGGRAVFGPMSVLDNLKAFGYTIAKDRAAIDAAIEESFEVFPRLAERRNQKAATLSGGEQQMLGLSKALMLKPRLLLIDELSLGLAPVIVSQLLDMVRKINSTGTAVVLVEQSVNIALGLVDHAYFMEKGEIRFDGTSNDLLARDDLLRAVFLEGAGAAV